ncbi:IclR family transcriptional regulator [Halostagnicola bangensis]
MNKENQMETIEATKTTFRILQVLIDNREPLGVTELANRTDIHKSTVYKHLYTLRKLGYVEKNNSKYRPSIRFVDFSHHITEHETMIQPIESIIDDLADTVNETAGLVIERNSVAVDVYVTRSQPERDTAPHNRRFLHCSAAGKALLSEWSPDAVKQYVTSEELPAITNQTLTEHQTLLDEISRVRDHGFAFDRQEQYQGVNSVATSVTHPEFTAAVYVSGKPDELSGKRFKDIIPGTLQSTARKVESSFA